MKLGIMQPYLFPYLGYFDLINYSDKWIIFDTVQYIRRGWMNRNRILSPQDGWNYIRIPVKKHHRETLIKDIFVQDQTDWRSHILGQIRHYKKAPYFTQVQDLLHSCFDSTEDRLSKINGHTLEKTCQYLGIPFHCKYFSEMDLLLGQVDGPGDWALRISEVLEATEYVNPPGGIDLFDPLKFEELGIKLTIRTFPPMQYQPWGQKFIPGLSILDVLMWNSPEQVMEYLNNDSI